MNPQVIVALQEASAKFPNESFCRLLLKALDKAGFDQGGNDVFLDFAWNSDQAIIDALKGLLD